MTSQAPTMPLSAPTPIPRKYSLLDVAQTIVPTSDRWLGGVASEGFPSGPAFTFDPCATGTDRLKEDAGVIPGQEAGRFTVYKSARCNAKFIGPNPTAWVDRLKLAFIAVEAQAVERVFATGDGFGDAFGSYLGDENMEDLSGPGSVTPLEGLALLEQAIGAANAGMGVIHATPSIATYWASMSLLDDTRNLLYTVAAGTPVVVGAGYIGVTPDGGSVPGAGEEWAFASSPIEIRSSDLMAQPADYSQALDRSNNDVLYLAEREYLLNWAARQSPTDPDHIQAGVLIARGT